MLKCHVGENERTPTPVRRFEVRLHAAGLSIRETAAILKILGVDCSHGAVWNWVHTLSEAQSDPQTAVPSRVAVDEKQIEVDGEKKWLYAAVDVDSKLLLEVDVYSRRGTDPRRSRELCSRATHQKSPISEDGVPAPAHRKTRRRRYRVSRGCWRLSDCPLTSRFERLT